MNRITCALVTKVGHVTVVEDEDMSAWSYNRSGAPHNALEDADMKKAKFLKNMGDEGMLFFLQPGICADVLCDACEHFTAGEDESGDDDACAKDKGEKCPRMMYQYVLIRPVDYEEHREVIPATSEGVRIGGRYSSIASFYPDTSITGILQNHGWDVDMGETHACPKEAMGRCRHYHRWHETLGGCLFWSLEDDMCRYPW
jgi:hypothetical protein